jgi:Family of unknown function (DUF5317)
VVFLDFALIGLAAGLLAGGSFSALAETSIRGKGYAFAAIALQLAAFPSNVLPWGTSTTVASVLWILSDALLIVMLFQNRRLPGLLVVAAGLASNLIAILANGGLMPVLPGALRAAGIHYQLHNNSIRVVHPHLGLLVDRWAVPQWLPLGNVYSVGDVLIALGMVITVVMAMRAKRTPDLAVTPDPAAPCAVSVPAELAAPRS